MQHNAAVMFIDTGTLLTLLLGHHEEIGYKPVENGNGSYGSELPPNLGYASLVLSLARAGLIEVKLADMVVAEFLGVQGPVYAHDIQSQPPAIKARDIPNGFQFRKERIVLLKELLKTGHAQIIQTKAGDEQLERVRLILQAIKKDEKRELFCEKKDTAWIHGEIDSGALRTRLLDSGSKLSSAVRRNGLILKPHDMDSAVLDKPDYFVQGQFFSNYSDRGEISIADAMHEWQKANPDCTSFVLFEGGDVRGRVIQRMVMDRALDPETAPDQKPRHLAYTSDNGKTETAPHFVDAYHYHQVGKPRARYNPNLPTFQQKGETYVDKLGDFNFLTTKSFLYGLMRTTKNIRDIGAPKSHAMADVKQLYLLSPDEVKNEQSFDQAYASIIDNVRSNGLPRNYDRMHDEPIKQVGKHGNGFRSTSVSKDDTPWQAELRGIYRDKTAATQLVDALTQFSHYRDVEHGRACEDVFAYFLKQAQQLPAAILQPLLNFVATSLQHLQPPAPTRGR